MLKGTIQPLNYNIHAREVLVITGPMKNYSLLSADPLKQEWGGISPMYSMPAELSLVSPSEVDELRTALNEGIVPMDLEYKLQRLAQGSLLHCSVEQNCRVFIALLLASYRGSFNEASRHQLDLLVQVLAYVRKENDSIADCKPNGFVDDQLLVRAAANDLVEVLHRFKAWRLRIQVPDLWDR
jgi:hypothetical protein